MKSLSTETKVTLSFLAFVIGVTLAIALRVIYLMQTGYYETLF